ncbi:MAG: threonylcarbamoyl-AMP synthase [Ruminococcaceae bacterium]|nr:threonylcarbamoyl-AMP synthase [Oscillospiraceae bacterium]
MDTLHLTNTTDDITKAGQLLKAGELVAIPTETVYGLAANALDAQAVAGIFAAKERPADNPLIVHIDDKDTVYSLWETVTEEAKALMDAFWPGPLTIILPRAACVPDIVSAGLPTVAVRMPSHETARAIIRAAGVPLAAPSANRSGSPSPTTAARVAADMDGRIAAVVDGGDCEVGVESTVISLCGETPTVLRPGGITPAQLEAVLGTVAIADSITRPLAEGEVVASPGMKYKHYAPRAQVTIVRGDAAAFAAYVNARADEGVMAMAFDGETQALNVPFVTYGAREDRDAQARELFEALRLADDRGATVLYAACPPVDGVGLAVYNRLLRAAAFRVVNA